MRLSAVLLSQRQPAFMIVSHEAFDLSLGSLGAETVRLSGDVISIV